MVTEHPKFPGDEGYVIALPELQFLEPASGQLRFDGLSGIMAVQFEVNDRSHRIQPRDDGLDAAAVLVGMKYLDIMGPGIGHGAWGPSDDRLIGPAGAGAVGA